jgi:FG-GAP-like repeat
MRLSVLALLTACDAAGPGPLAGGSDVGPAAAQDAGQVTLPGDVEMGGWAPIDDPPDDVVDGDTGSPVGRVVECPDPGVDADGDGFGANAECDDSDPSSHPAAAQWRANYGRYVEFDLGSDLAVAAIGDIDGDGYPDAVVPSPSLKAIVVYLGAPDLEVAEAMRIEAGGPVKAVALFDADRDGALDVIASVNGDIEVHRGAGDGTFPVAPTVVESGCEDVMSLVALDLDLDGRLDLGGSCTDQGFVALYATGDGSFAPDLVAAPFAVMEADVGDFDMDGDDDVVLGGNESLGITFVWNHGSGNLRASGHPFPAGTNAIEVSDVDGDGDPDLLLGHLLDTDVTWLQNDGSGSFTQFRVPGSPSGRSGSPASGLTSLDVDLDGFPEIVVHTRYSGSTLFRGSARGPVFWHSLGLRDNSVASTGADFDQDGWPDLVVSGPDGQVLFVAGAGDGTFLGPANLTLDGITSMASADIDGDGLPDLATGRWDGTVAWATADGSGGYQPAGQADVGGNHPALVAADLDLDGNIDLATTSTGGLGTIELLFLDGRGTLLRTAAAGLGGDSDSLLAADLDLDGDLDLLAIELSTNTLRALLNDGRGGFDTQVTTTTGSWPRAMAVADLNGDGWPDVVTGSFGLSAFEVWAGLGDGAFEQIASLAMDHPPEVVAAGDIEGDGDVDLLLGEEGTGNARVALNDGTGRSWRGSNLWLDASTEPYFFTLADLNGDCAVDLISTTAAAEPQLHLGDGRGSLTAAGTLTPEMSGDFIASLPIDADGDGLLDVAIASDSQGVQVFFQTCD